MQNNHSGHSHHHGEQTFDPNQLLATEEMRRRFMPPERILSEFLVAPNTVLADIGCGVGFFTIPAAKMLPEGKVYAVDLQQNMVDATMQRALEDGIANVHGITASATDLPLDNESVDAVLMSMMFHDVPQQDEMLSEVKRILKPEGSFYMVEWDRVATDLGPPMEIRIRPNEMTEKLERVGFRIESVHDSEEQKAVYFVHARAPKN